MACLTLASSVALCLHLRAPGGTGLAPGTMLSDAMDETARAARACVCLCVYARVTESAGRAGGGVRGLCAGRWPPLF